MSSTPLALFVGIPNPTLSDDEFALFRETNPLGLFVGRRNQREPAQTRALIERFREAVGREDAPSSPTRKAAASSISTPAPGRCFAPSASSPSSPAAMSPSARRRFAFRARPWAR